MRVLDFRLKLDLVLFLVKRVEDFRLKLGASLKLLLLHWQLSHSPLLHLVLAFFVLRTGNLRQHQESISSPPTWPATLQPRPPPSGA